MFTRAANQRFTIWTVGCWALFIALTSVASGMKGVDLGSPVSIGLSLAIGVPIVLHVAATIELVNSADEFARAITFKRFAIAWSVSTAVFCAWGFSEQYAATPHAPAWVIYPLFWIAFAFVSLIVRSSR
ncbi:hypothetical protein ACMGDH_01365 [Sphingomonas sp. DT-207]|uniref:hypothetical protein n=1 Tax=Sphingomonas sp. DT-207 TaxID=3396167 RepID=UPI003F1D8131